MHKVFVYGTMKEGFPNFKTNKGKRYGTTFSTKENYPLYLVGERYSPWLVLDNEKGQPVKGQVFEVSDRVLSDMDVLERIHEPDGYRRVLIQVTDCHSNEELEVYMYGKPKEMAVTADIQVELHGEYLLQNASLYRGRCSS